MQSQSNVTKEQAHRARIAVAALFFTNGALFANILPRYPEIKDLFDLSNSAYGFIVILFPVGAIVAGLTSASLVRRFGSANVAVAGMVLTALALFAAGSSSTALLFGVFLFLGGAVDAVSDVGQNAHAMQVQKSYGRSIINSFHATWSIGAVTGGGMAAAAIALDLSLSVHLAIVAVLFIVVLIFARMNTLPERDEVTDEDNVADSAEIKESITKVTPKAIFLLAALVLLSIAGAVMEEVGNSWATLYLSSSLGAAPAIAAFGYIALVGGQFIGRVLGDRQVDRWGHRAVARTGGFVTAIGMGLALAFPTVAGSIIGFALAGYGSATLVPTAFDQADKIQGLREGTGITVISWLMRIGNLATPPLIGLIADAASIRAGLLLLPIAGIIVILFSGTLPNKKDNEAEAEEATRSVIGSRSEQGVESDRLNAEQ